MKKAVIIILIIAALIGGSVFAYKKFDIHIDFIDNYAQNFSDNLFNLKLKYEMKKIENQENISENAAVSPSVEPSGDTQDSNPEETLSPDYTDAAQEPEVSQAPAEKDKNEKVAVPGKHEISTRSSTKVVKTQKKKENGESVDVLTKKLVGTSAPIAFNDAAKSQYSRYRDGILCALENKLVLYDKHGKEKHTTATSISNPIMKVTDAYILLWEKDSQNAVVYRNNKKQYSITAADKILNGYVSSSGECVLVTAKQFYKGEVKVYNKTGSEIYARSFGTESVMCAALSDSRKLAVSLLSANGQANSKVAFFDVNKADEDCAITYENTIIYDMEFYSGNLIAYADDKLISLKTNASESWVYPYKDKVLNHMQKDSKDIRLLMFDNQNNAELSVISLNGREQQKISTEVIPDFGDICSGYILYCDERNLYLSRTDGTLLAKYSASRDIHKAYFLDNDNILIVYNSSIEFLHTEKGE